MDPKFNEKCADEAIAQGPTHQCCRCRNKHSGSDRVMVRTGPGESSSRCPKCNGESYYDLRGEEKVNWHSLSEIPISGVPLIVRRNCGVRELQAYYSAEHANYYCQSTRCGLGDTITGWRYFDPEELHSPRLGARKNLP